MPIGLPGIGRGGGGVSLTTRIPPDVFADAATRSTAFSSGGMLDGQHVDFAQNRSLAIIIGSLTNPTWYTYTGDDGVYDDTAWLNQGNIAQGIAGPQARFIISQWMLVTVIPAAAPTGGSYVLTTGVLTASIGWSTAKLTPGSNQILVRSDAPINPAVQTGTITPAWSLPFEDIDEAIADRVEAAQTAAETAQTAAETAETNAETAETNAETAETNAETAETAAELAQTRAEAAQSGAETALQSSGTALAFHELWSGDIDITTANQWKAIGTVAVPSNATWLIWNGGQASDGSDDGPAALSTWIDAAVWRALTADTVDTTPGDGTGMLMVDWIATNIGDGTPDFARRDAVIGRTSADIPLITSTNTGEDFYGASLKYITQAVATPGGGGGASSFSDLTGQIADSQVPAAFTRDTELSVYALLAGATFTGAVSGITPTADAHLSRKDYVDTADALKASLSGATFTGHARGVTPAVDADFATKAYVDAGDTGTTPPSVRSELIYYGEIASAAEAATVNVSTLNMADATVEGHEITLGPSTDGEFFVILVPLAHVLLTLVNTGTQADALSAYTRDDTSRMLGTPLEQYVSYTLGPLNAGVTITYRLTLMES